MSRLKVVYDGEWVSVANGMNKRFPTGLQPCRICRRATCGSVWFSIRSNEVRCKRCFAPQELR